METWNDLAGIYTNLSQWRDAEVCLAKSKAISPFSASRLHHTGRSFFLLLLSILSTCLIILLY